MRSETHRSIAASIVHPEPSPFRAIDAWQDGEVQVTSKACAGHPAGQLDIERQPEVVSAASLQWRGMARP